MTLLKELFEAKQALLWTDLRRERLAAVSEVLLTVTRIFSKTPSRDNMIALNGIWSHAERVLKECAQTEPTPPLAGTPEVFQEAERKVA